MRILLVSHPPVTAELGAAQIALNLAEGLRALGHDAAAWSPEPLPPGTRWWNLWRRQTEGIERYVESHGPFDVIDTPAISASREVARHGRRLVVRSVQPELRYLWRDLRSDLSRRPSPRALANALLGAPRAGAITGGWRRADAILCLGSHELEWMRRRFPRWTGKLGVYLCALPAGERVVLAEVRRQRTGPGRDGLRFLWMGRWSAQKGTARLLRFLRERIASSPGDTFTLAGCGPAAERDLPAKWLAAGRVRVVPAFSRAELPELLASHDAGLFTSGVEGWGLSLTEMLESGMTVFATEAGAVADLRPWFPHSLRPFPPPTAIELPAEREDLEANGYYAQFDWRRIAEDYERQALVPERER
ncbi:MAG TPA: glycosyltransferase family 4 protein [Thermoanaerobaculia bacterium]